MNGVRRKFIPLVGACGLATLWLAGCGRGDGPKRVAVAGSVMHRGSSLKSGTISFLPDKGLKAPAATTDVANGQYRFTVHDGPIAGPYQVVVVRAPEGKGIFGDTPVKRDPRAPPGAAAPKPPAGRWELRTEVPAKASFRYDVELP